MTEETPWWEVYQSLGFMTAPKQSLTLQAWARMFEAEGRGSEDLVTAAYAIARREKIPSFAEEHLEAIRQELRRIDSDRALKAPVLTNARECPVCGNAGVVCGLPHSRFIDDNGFWMASTGGPEYTQAAACDRCALGRSRPAGQMCNLTQYEQVNPYWAEQLRYHRQYRTLKAQALRATAQDPGAQVQETATQRLALDKFFEELRARMAQARGDNGGGEGTDSAHGGTAIIGQPEYSAGV